MELSETPRLSGLASILNENPKKINKNFTDRPYASASIMSTSVLSASTYDHPPPYPGRPSNSGLVSPAESRRISGNEKSIPPPIHTSGNHGFSLPSIHEVTGTSAGYGSPMSAPLPPSAHSVTLSHGQPPHSAPRPYPAEHTPYPTFVSTIQRKLSPSPYQPVFSSWPRPEERQYVFTEAPNRHKAIQPVSVSHSTYPAPQFEVARHEHDPRPREVPSGYQRGVSMQQQPYHYGNNTQMSPAQHDQTYAQPKIERRDSRDLSESWKGTKMDPATAARAAARQGVKRHLDIYDFENNLAEINNASSELQNWSFQFNQIAQEQQRPIGSIPARMPDTSSIEDMMAYHLTIGNALERMKHMIQTQASQDRYDRDQGPREFDNSMYGEDSKSQGFGQDNKKRRGVSGATYGMASNLTHSKRAAPPGRCHSCNRAETPEWRRGPDGARTLCNACGLHYAKLTRKNSQKQSQSSSGSNLRPKTMDDDNIRPM